MQSFRVVSTCIKENRLHVVKEIVEDDGTITLNLHVMPRDAIEWRMAETGIEDIDTVFEMVLCEPHGIGRDKIKDRQANGKAQMVKSGVTDPAYLNGADNDHMSFVREMVNAHKDNIEEKRERLKAMRVKGLT